MMMQLKAKEVTKGTEKYKGFEMSPKAEFGEFCKGSGHVIFP